MKLIVGLGNPGRIYIDSRHNIGFSLIKTLSRIYKIPLKKDNHTFSLSGKGHIEGQNLILALPLTFMNLSGIAVSALLKKYKIDLPRPSLKYNIALNEGRGLENLLVVCDDLDLGLGRMRIKSSGSAGGHLGLESIIDSLGSQEFCRLRIGIGRPLNKNIDPVRNLKAKGDISNGVDAVDYVLSSFTRKEKEEIKQIIEKACDCCRVWVTKGITESMNIFNRAS